tara:strand:+ start:131 stop:643 length:513 start_codon:yes stop_codon:yes gene_type:complete
MINNFDIHIKDNFFNKNDFQKLKETLPTLQYDGLGNMLSDNPKHVWFSHPTDPKITCIVKDKIEKILNKKFKVVLSSYTLLATSIALPHSDEIFCDYQAIIYIKGNNNLHKGTGFYIFNEENKKYELNTHVGFKENRVVIWESSAYHSPMNWASEDKSKRFSVIIQFKKL